ncbi:hypothetical protein P153DRAFT_307217 [Dothidotthia symphoricarpi CBS 119687]|uniref:Coenzyme Q-binding protein COQ10 START domain-containing protein n=1 Tax=Dothidotthia symphoricarpi CBS 119687 TaxID=1392245 RepID=A0A6A6ATE1_9PLEO|nr:uncharacterized protein P153DRAFT_307217 [Dothidotthia symphoricarpi CBS 119687]KAF2134225.1 hypothetical protein P153DRAFT_307217 [Dothidotthia symphoricarpi CBS 119687]
MATPKVLGHLSRPSICLPYSRVHRATQRRTFLPNPFASAIFPSTEPQTLTARRILPYASAPVYSIIADIPNYHAFLPYCHSSDITQWSAPDQTYSRRWPSEGILTSGYGNITESFTSRVYCVPGKVVESVGGKTETSLSREEVSHHLKGGEQKAGDVALLTHLRSKWTIEELGKDKTEVTLALEFAFANPLYAALSGGAAPKVADRMIRAFEERVGSLLVANPDMARASLAEFDGSRLKR